jgi:cathepsin D
MYFSPALVLAALPFLVAAAPVDESPRDGFSIPIAKRSVIRNADGAVDTAKLLARTRHTLASVFRFSFLKTFTTFLTTGYFPLSRKIQRGFDAFELNTGSAHPSASQLKRSTKRGNGVPLIDDNSLLWYGPITVGTPAITYTGGSPFRHWEVTVAKVNPATYSGL